MADDLDPSSKPDSPQPGLRFRQGSLLVLVAGISLLFVMVVRDFLLATLLAAILAGLTYPLYRWLRGKFGDRPRLAAAVTILALVLGVGLPLAGFLALVVSEAIQIGHSASEWVQEQDSVMTTVRDWLERLPYSERLLPPEGEFAAELRSLVERIGPTLVNKAATVTRLTFAFFLQLFIVLYALYFFLVDGMKILATILRYLPLGPDQEEALLERFVSVTRATLKGSLLVGVIQGALAAISFWIAGVPGSAFWGAVMVVLSVIPAIGAALVWIPTVIYLFLASKIVAAVGLLLWCGIVVSLIDNFLRPRLVGRDARMSDLMILLSTLGGLALFGPIGFIVGPLVAALFVAIWHIYGTSFDGWLLPLPATLRDQLDAERRAEESGPHGEADADESDADESDADEPDEPDDPDPDKDPELGDPER